MSDVRPSDQTLGRRESVTFRFRVWLHPVDGDPPEIEIWYDGLEDTRPNRRFYSDWARESFDVLDFRRVFEIEDEDNEWQIVGNATLRGWFDYFGEYDEECSVGFFAKQQVRNDFWTSHHIEIVDDDEPV